MIDGPKIVTGAVELYQTAILFLEKHKRQSQDDSASTTELPFTSNVTGERPFAVNKLNGVAPGNYSGRALFEEQVRHRCRLAFVLGRLKSRDGSKDKNTK